MHFEVLSSYICLVGLGIGFLKTLNTKHKKMFILSFFYFIFTTPNAQNRP